MNKSLFKAISVIRSFGPQQLELGPSEVAGKLKISRATAHRILKTLTATGLLEQDEKTRKYTIGPVLYFLGNLYLSTRDVSKVADPIMQTINELTGEGVNLSIFDKGYIVIIMKALAKSAYRYDLHIGAMVPAHTSSMGKAFLSELTEAELDNLYPGERLQPRTAKSIVSKTELKSHLAQIRKTGVSFTREEGTEGIEGIASLIRDGSGKAIAAISIHLPVFKANDTIREQFGILIKMGSNLVSYRLGYHDSPNHKISEIRAWWDKTNRV